MAYPKPIRLEATSESPKVCLDVVKNVLQIHGRSLPENPFEFYQPLINWMELYVQDVKSEISFDVNLEYFNSSSGRYILELFQVFEKNNVADRCKILWHCHEEDELMLEKGEEYKLLVEAPVEVILLSDS